MTHHPFQHSKASLDELIFRGRNKAYGAFHLRQVYPDHLKRSMILILFTGVALVLAFRIGSTISLPTIDDRPITDTTSFTRYDPIDIPDQKPAETAPASSISDPAEVVPTIVEQAIEKPEEKKPAGEPIITPDASSGPATAPSGSGLGSGSGIGTQMNNGIEKELNEIFEFAEKDPRFPGGHERLAEFLGHEVRFTPESKENEEEGTVLIRFVVNEDGRIDQIEVLQGLKYGLTDIALKAVKRMPRWEPGMNNGKPVKVRMELPITFKLD